MTTRPLANPVAQWTEAPSAAMTLTRVTLVLIGGTWYASDAGGAGDGVVVIDGAGQPFAKPNADALPAGYTATQLLLANSTPSYY